MTLKRVIEPGTRGYFRWKLDDETGRARARSAGVRGWKNEADAKRAYGVVTSAIVRLVAPRLILPWAVAALVVGFGLGMVASVLFAR